MLQYAAGNHTLLLGRGGAFDPTHLQEMTFGELLELRLHGECCDWCMIAATPSLPSHLSHHPPSPSPILPRSYSPLPSLPPSPTAHYLEVLAVVEHAERDVAIESLLKTLEEVWLSRQLELRPYQRATGLSRQEVSGRPQESQGT